MLDKDDINVSDDQILLTEIMEEHAIPVKRLAAESGRAASTVYKYCSGEKIIPSIIWRTLYRLTNDARIPRLLTGGVPTVVVPVLAGPLKINRPTIRLLLQQRQKALLVEQTVLNILDDGIVDHHDHDKIKKYNRDFPDLVQSLYQVHEAINREYEKSKSG